MTTHDPIAKIAPEWVEHCLHRAGELRSGTVTDVSLGASFHSCTALNTPISVTYSADAGEGHPHHLMLRCWYDGAGPGDREVRFYEEIAPQCPDAPTVPCYDTAWDGRSRRWHTLLLDIRSTHDQAPQPLTRAQREFLMPSHAVDDARPRALSEERYASLARAYATLHARWWNDRLIGEERHCASIGGPHCLAGVAFGDSIISIAEHWREQTLPRYREEHPDDPAPARWRVCERVLEAWPDLLTQRAATGGLTLVRADAHLGNVFFSRDPGSDHLYLLDWDAYTHGIGPYDLAYLFVVSHAPEIRRQTECEVLQMYHRRLTSCGVADYSYDQCLADYRLAILASLFPPIAWKKPVFLDDALAAFDDWNCRELLG